MKRLRRKIPKTLSGIETTKAELLSLAEEQAGKYLKPYQGLKQADYSRSSFCRAGKYLKPYQGLKHPRHPALLPALLPPENT